MLNQLDWAPVTIVYVLDQGVVLIVFNFGRYFPCEWNK